MYFRQSSVFLANRLIDFVIIISILPCMHSSWQKKRERNMQRDKEVAALFKARGWVVLRIWECELKRINIDKTAEKIRQLLAAIPSCQERT
jgi:G:T-mismatch repair DNA endonuclease (very short patch repair protein)